jgi:hypothetical protein
MSTIMAMTTGLHAATRTNANKPEKSMDNMQKIRYSINITIHLHSNNIGLKYLASLLF